ncbi:hypothetical protein J2X97_002222 [Epilithonimonas hungarica]|nr:hypothetical protein [Epilithonimonas hungarica]
MANKFIFFNCFYFRKKRIKNTSIIVVFLKKHNYKKKNQNQSI